MTEDTVRNEMPECSYQQNLCGWNGLAARGLVMALSALHIALVGGVDEFPLFLRGFHTLVVMFFAYIELKHITNDSSPPCCLAQSSALSIPSLL